MLMISRFFLLSIFVFSIGLLSAQHPLSKFNKVTHLSKLKQGVLLVRLPDQESKIAELTKRGQSQAAESLRKETEDRNALIIKAFQTHFKFCSLYFIRPKDTKSILANNVNNIKDIVTNEIIGFSSFEDIYVTDYAYGHPAEGYERYNRKGFQILYMEEGRLTDLGRDLFYAGVKQGFFSPNFSKSLQKTVGKLNRRLFSGSKYFN